MLTSLSLACLLLVAAGLVRLNTNLSSDTVISVQQLPELYLPQSKEQMPASVLSLSEELEIDQQLANIEFTSQASRTVAATAKNIQPKFVVVKKQRVVTETIELTTEVAQVVPAQEEWRKVSSKTHISTAEVIELRPVQMVDIKPTTLVALADQLILPQETMVAEVNPVRFEEKAEIKEDIVTTQMAAVVEEPSFFEYNEDKPSLETVEVQKLAEAKETVKEAKRAPAVIEAPVSAEYSLPDDVAVTEAEHAAGLNIQPRAENFEDITMYPMVETRAPVAITQTGKVNTQKKPWTVPTHKTIKENAVAANGYSQKQMDAVATQQSAQKSGTTTAGSMDLSIKAVAVELNTVDALTNFQIRPESDDTETRIDHGSGQVTFHNNIRGEGTRGFELMAHGRIPTHFDVAMGVGSAYLEVPSISEEMMAKYESKHANQSKATGYLLVDLDENTETVSVDGIKPKTTTLSSKFLKSNDNYRYLLMTGVEAGNRLMTVTNSRGEKTYKVIFVHAGELTYEAIFLRNSEVTRISLVQKGTMSEVAQDLSLSQGQVRSYFANKDLRVLGGNFYATHTRPTLIGAREYLELITGQEPIYVGLSDQTRLEVPDESYIRNVIAKFRLGKSAQACLVQINLPDTEIAQEFSVNAESYDKGLVSYAQVMDNDGSFHESLGEKSRKIFVMAENQSGDATANNGRIHLKIKYVSGREQHLISPCSPESYLVEQL